MKPERGPPMVLCTVDEVTCAWGTGFGCRPAATRPAKCAMSTQRIAPTSSAIARNAAKSSWRGYADQPAMMTFGLCSSAFSTHHVHVDEEGLGVDAVRHDVVELAREVELHAVREVATVRKLEAEDLVARLSDRGEHRGVRLRARVGLDVRVLGTKQALRAVDARDSQRYRRTRSHRSSDGPGSPLRTCW